MLQRLSVKLQGESATIAQYRPPILPFELESDRPQPHSPQYHLIDSRTTVCTPHGFCDRLSNGEGDRLSTADRSNPNWGNSRSASMLEAGFMGGATKNHRY